MTDTRTSFNSWVERDRSPVVDAIYRRAGDVMRIDEALLRNRDKDERPDFPTKGSLAEHLQLVHYDPGQEYTAHHDFGFSDLSELQGARFATLLLYLNDEGLVGGETTFPRWVNAEAFDKLKVKPKEGKVRLFHCWIKVGAENFGQLTHYLHSFYRLFCSTRNYPMETLTTFLSIQLKNLDKETSG